jgi:hypothetical protein
MRLFKSSVCIIASLVSLLPAYVVAQDGATPGFGNAASSEALESFRGGSDAVNSEMTLAGTTAKNSAEQVNTGTNSINTGAFANLSGIPIVIQNSGANVLIQNATILNLQIH